MQMIPPKISYDRPFLYQRQAEFLDDPSRFTFIEAGTKSGKTIGCIIWIHEQAIKGKQNQVRWWVAPYYNQAKIAFTRLWNFIPPQIRHLFKKNEADLSITYPNNARILFKSGEKPDALYGEDVWDVVIDEASRMREDSWNAIRTTLTATQGRGKVIGNVKGKKNWFYKLAQEAKHEGKGYYRLTSYENPFLSQDEIDYAKKNLPEAVFKELYLSEPTDDGANPFGIEYISRCIKPISTKEVQCYGIDLAKSFDWTVILGLDNNKDICYLERFQKDWKQTREFIIDKIGNTPTLLDSTGVGDPIVEDIQRYCKRAEGFKYSQHSKQQLMEGLAVNIQNGTIGLIEGVLRYELESFEFEYTRSGVRYNAPSGMHDDCVNALALGNSIHSKSKSYGRYAVM